MSSKGDILREGINAAHVVLQKCAHPSGIYASGLPGGYAAVWARDSMMAAVCATLAGADVKEMFRRSLLTLGAHQGAQGQIPNAVGSYNTDRRSDITYNAIDANLWYLIGWDVYRKYWKGEALFRREKTRILRALHWLECQDPDNVGLLAQQPTTDWQDAFPHKYGYTIYAHALYYLVLRKYGKKAHAEELRATLNGGRKRYLALFDPRRGYYLPWAWKKHLRGREEGTWFDTLGNVLAIVTGLATPSIARSILRHIASRRIDAPYPCRAIDPPLRKSSGEWQEYFEDSDARTPYWYLNGGIWPFIGGWYGAALAKMREFRRARRALALLAAANRKVRRGEKVPGGKWGFHEWLHGRKGAIGEGSSPYQAWSAGAFLLAAESVERGKGLRYFS
ncbi:hypothetical protein D6833_10520 [Candidatus Parcubacteria bacterium]|nr:MAG: hypothetical protein D6833_10520 [Candidatus Parcubacteria bacterium]